MGMSVHAGSAVTEITATRTDRRNINNEQHADELDSKACRNIVGHGYLLRGEEYYILLSSWGQLGIIAFAFKTPLGH